LAAVLAILLLPGVSNAAASYQLLPYVGVMEVFDDNLFGVPSGGTTVTSPPPAGSSAPPTTTHLDRDSDFITRFTPGLRGTIQQGLFTLTGGYRFYSDIYAEHSEFTSGFAAQDADANATYDVSPNLTAGVNGTYAQSESGQSLSGGTNPFLSTQNQQFLTGVQTGRGRSQALSVGPTVDYRISSATSIDTTYRFSSSDQVGGSRSEINQGAVALNRILTPVDTGSLVYSVTDSSFSEDGTASEQNSALRGSEPGGSLSQVIMLGWTRELSKLTTLTLRAGPRITSGSVASAEAHAAISHLFERGNVELAYSRTQNTIVGAVGTFDTDTVWLGGAYQIRPDFGIWSRVSYFRNSGEETATNSELFEIGTGYALNTWLSIQATYQFRYQDNVLVSNASSSGDVYTNVVQIGFFVSYPMGGAPSLPSPWVVPGSGVGLGTY
jgi:hypothetical protein